MWLRLGLFVTVWTAQIPWNLICWILRQQLLYFWKPTSYLFNAISVNSLPVSQTDTQVKTTPFIKKKNQRSQLTTHALLNHTMINRGLQGLLFLFIKCFIENSCIHICTLFSIWTFCVFIFKGKFKSSHLVFFFWREMLNKCIMFSN